MNGGGCYGVWHISRYTGFMDHGCIREGPNAASSYGARKFRRVWDYYIILAFWKYQGRLLTSDRIFDNAQPAKAR